MTLPTQLVSFGAIGIINTAIDVGTYAALIAMGLPTWAAVIISTSCGLVCSFILNHRFTFGGSGITTQAMPRFIAVNLVGLWALQPAIVWLLSQGFNLTTVLQLTIAKLVATGASMVWNFCWYRRYVFN